MAGTERAGAGAGAGAGEEASAAPPSAAGRHPFPPLPHLQECLPPVPSSEWGLDPLFWCHVKLHAAEVLPGPSQRLHAADGGGGAVGRATPYLSTFAAGTSGRCLRNQCVFLSQLMTEYLEHAQVEI